MPTDKIHHLPSDAQYLIDPDLCGVNGWSTSRFQSPASAEFHRAITEQHNRPLLIQHVKGKAASYVLINNVGHSHQCTKQAKGNSIGKGKKLAFYWTDEEDAIIRRVYPSGGVAAVIRSIRDILHKERSKCSIFGRASFLRVRFTGIKGPGFYKSRGHPKKREKI